MAVATSPQTRLAQPRPVQHLVRGRPTSDGAGVRLNRLIGTPNLGRVDPFLMLDEFRSDRADDYIAGFPNHPHRGFETVTYMLAGRMRHGDNQGNSGLLTAGSVQWMTAGRGIVHSEMPEQEDGLMWGFQLWVNLPARDKMTAPRYQDIAPERIPVLKPTAGISVKLIAGELDGVQGPVNAVATEPVFMDIGLAPGTRWQTQLPAGHSAFVYVFEGEAELGNPGRRVQHGELAVLGEGDGVQLQAGPQTPARLLLVAGKPLREPIAHYGPFVMNTEAELRQAIDDYQNGRF